MDDKKYDILVVGELNVDLILNKIQSFPEMGKEKIAGDMSLVLGSSSAILASNLSSLGAKVGFVGVLGKDSFGDLALKTLHDKGVDTSLIIKSEEYATGLTVVMSFDNDRANVTYAGAMEALTIDDVTDDIMSQARHLHFSSVFLQTGIMNDLVLLFERAKALGLTTSLDPQWDPEENWNLDLNGLLPHVDFFMPNVQELTAITGEEDVELAVSSVNSPNAIIVKMGTKGACVYHSEGSNTCPAFLNKNVVDTVGAGDSFNAGFLFRFLQGAPVSECMVFGAFAGAVNTTEAGGTGAFESYSGVIEIMKNKFGYTEDKSYEITR